MHPIFPTIHALRPPTHPAPNRTAPSSPHARIPTPTYARRSIWRVGERRESA